MDWNSNIGQAIGSAGMGVASSGVSALLGLAGARMQYNYNKKLMALQNQYQIEAFNRELDAVRKMPTLQKEALKAAGYSTADPSGTGFQQVSPSQGDVGLPSSSVNLGSADFAHAFSSLSAARLAESQANLVEKQASRYNELTDAQILELQKKAFHDQMAGDLSNAEATQIDVLLPILKEKGYSEVAKIRAETKIIDKNVDLISEEINKVIQETNTSKAQEEANRASAQQSRSSAALNAQLIEQSKQDVQESQSRIDINKEEARKRAAEADQARQDAIWSALRIELRKIGVDIDATQTKQSYQKLVYELQNCKDQNAVKRCLKRWTGTTLRGIDYLLENASGVVAGAVGYGAGRKS